MLTIESSMYVPRMRATRVIDFFLNPSDDLYRRWWPGVHLALHPLNRSVGVGQVVHMDELVGGRRIKCDCVVTEVESGGITWRLRRLVWLPCRFTLRIIDDEGGATITHTIRAGFNGRLTRLADPLLRLYFSPRFERMMDAHFRTEFAALPRILEREDEALSA